MEAAAVALNCNVKIIAILTSHDRRSETLTCLRSFFSQSAKDFVELEAVLVDDGSSDGTVEAVRDLKQPVAIVMSADDLFWARAMALAEERALRVDPDYLLWLNDDVVLDPDALERLRSLAIESGNASVVVGALRDPEIGEVTYSGLDRHRLHPLRFDRVEPAEDPLTVDTFNGNVVLVPRAVSAKVGRIDGEFAHGIADFDYGARVVKAGLVNLLAPGTVGTCSRDSAFAPWLDRSLPLRERASLLFGRKGVPPRSRARYLRRHGGPFWPIFWLMPYVNFLFSLAPRYRKRDAQRH